MVSKMAERVYCLYRGKNQESILMQKNACHDFTEKIGWNIVGEEQEIDVSGYYTFGKRTLSAYAAVRAGGASASQGLHRRLQANNARCLAAGSGVCNE